MPANHVDDWMGDLTGADALLIVDVQLDLLPGGALAVPDGDDIIEPLNHFAAQFARRGLLVVAARAWHPANHASFKALGGRWPQHCIAGTHGAEYTPELVLPAGTRIVSQGKQPESDGYSAFENTELSLLLSARGIRRVFIGGLATEYCVRATALDALRAGFEVCVLADAVRPVEARKGDGARALAELAKHGVLLLGAPAAAAA